MDLPFPPGQRGDYGGPLARFLPPLEDGMVRRALETIGPSGERLLDPFGAAPQLAIEAALSGRAVLAAANNPVLRFILRHTAQPFPLGVLQAAVARLAAAPKDDLRLEAFLLDLYRTECARCGQACEADYFVWDREEGGPVARVYACTQCGHTGEDPTAPSDWERAHGFARRGLQHALALEQVAPAGDPDRAHAEAALSVYPARAVYALITLTSKLEQLALSSPLREAAQALLLSTFDAANALWGLPEGRARPLQLVASPRFREINVWRALERAVGEWARVGPAVAVSDYPQGGLPAPGSVAVFAGPARELLRELPAGAAQGLLTVPPRPNQAFWTLSALWAAWLWGRREAGPIKVALRRRRYDWNWHAAALKASLADVPSGLPRGAAATVLLPEAEPGFMAATLVGFDGAGFRLTGQALRPGEAQAVLAWAVDEAARPRPQDAGPLAGHAAAEALRLRGEPSSYLVVHAAAWCRLADAGTLASAWEQEEGYPLTALGEAVEQALAARPVFTRLGGGAEPESGHYWLSDPSKAEAALADRVEQRVLDALRAREVCDEAELDAALCAALPGWQTPERRLLLACLRSYALPVAATRRWRLRDEDRGTARAEDLAEMAALLTGLGERLGFRVETGDPIRWHAPLGGAVYAFRVRETAAMGEAMRAEAAEPGLAFVLPGGRASLLAELARRDPRLRDWLAQRGRVVKFRHVRRLASETTLRAGNLDDRLHLDPPESSDPQPPLL